MIEQISHLCFSCKDINITKKFYTKILKFRMVHEFRNFKDNKLYGIYLLIGKNTFIEFFQDKKTNFKVNNQFRHFCLKVKNLEKFKRYLKKYKIILTLKRGRTDNTLLSFIRDPNGILIELHEYDKKSKFFVFQKN